MSRYKNTQLKTDEYGKKSLRTTEYNSIPERDIDIYVITQLGDRLDSLAHQFYGNSHLWWYIAKANGLSDLRVKQGLSLRIPGDTKYATSI